MRDNKRKKSYASYARVIINYLLIIPTLIRLFSTIISRLEEDAKLAGRGLAHLLLLMLMLLICLFSTWFCVLGILFMWLTFLNFTGLSALSIIFCINIIIIVILLMLTIKAKKKLNFPHSRRLLHDVKDIIKG